MTTLYDFSARTLAGEEKSLSDYAGRVVLVVNTASKCGLTPQFTELEELNKRYADQGLAILGFPCNQFAGQEPGDADAISEVCHLNYGVTFPMFDKVTCKGPNKSPLYQVLSGPDSPFPGDVKWNFGKFLVGKDGKILKRFEPKTKPDAPEVVAAIKDALAAK